MGNQTLNPHYCFYLFFLGDLILPQALFLFRTIVDLYLPIDFYSAKLSGLIAEVEAFNSLLQKYSPAIMVRICEFAAFMFFFF